MSKPVILLGGQGDAASIGKAIIDANKRGHCEWSFAGFLNDRVDAGSLIEGHPVLGGLKDARKLVEDGYFFLNAIYRIDGNERRIRLFESLEIPEDRLAIFVHPTAYVAPDVSFSPGCVVMPNVCISPEASFGRGCVMLQACTIGHNDKIADYCHISAQACLGDHLDLRRGVHVGMSSAIRGRVTMHEMSTLGMGSTLLKDIGEREIWAGAPARFIRMARDE